MDITESASPVMTANSPFSAPRRKPSVADIFISDPPTALPGKSSDTTNCGINNDKKMKDSI